MAERGTRTPRHRGEAIAAPAPPCIATRLPVPIDSATFKSVLSQWASGVTIITARGPDGVPAGLTATSFSSLSLQPPLVLFCLGRDSTTFEAFQGAEGFAVHLLAADQQALSNRFAARGGDKFAGLDLRQGRWGTPLLPGCLATLECRVHARLPGGDHVIVVGALEGATLGQGEPLLYVRGAYRTLAAPPDAGD